MDLHEATRQLMEMTPPEEEENVDEESVDEPEELEASDESVDEAETDEDSDDEIEEVPDLHRVRVDGDEVEVTYDELLAGYSRQADYTRKTQAVAEKDKALEAERGELTTLRAQYVELLPQLRAQVENALGPEPDWEALYAQDPQQAAWLRLQRQEARDALQKSVQEEQQERQALMAEQRRRQEAYLLDQKERLAKVLPDLDGQRLANYGQSLGFTEQEMASVADHRMVVVLEKARLYDEALAKKDKIRPTRSKQRSATPGARESMPNSKKKARERQRQRFKESGKLDDAVTLLMME